MTIDERLSFFHELIGCNYQVYLWCYSADLTLLHTDCSPGNASGDAVSLADFSSSLLDYVKSGGRMPFILDTLPGLLYIAAFEYTGSSLNRIHIMGPAFTGRNSHLLLKKELDNRGFSVHLRSVIFRQLDQIPIIPTNQLYQYTVMFHYCITGKHITANDIQFSPGSDASSPDELNLISEEHRGVWTAEQALLKMFRDGNPDYKKALEAINLKFEKPENLNCMDYATRGYIYKKSGKNSESKKDFDKASKMCKNAERIKKIVSDDNYFENLYTEKKIKYNF